MIYFEPEIWGTVSDWVMITVTFATAFLLLLTLKSQKEVQRTQNELFRIEKRGYIREGYFADLVLIDPNKSWVVSPENILYKCGWSPMEGFSFPARIEKTFVNGNLVFDNGSFSEKVKGQALSVQENQKI